MREDSSALGDSDVSASGVCQAGDAVFDFEAADGNDDGSCSGGDGGRGVVWVAGTLAPGDFFPVGRRGCGTGHAGQKDFLVIVAVGNALDLNPDEPVAIRIEVKLLIRDFDVGLAAIDDPATDAFFWLVVFFVADDLAEWAEGRSGRSAGAGGGLREDERFPVTALAHGTAGDADDVVGAAPAEEVGKCLGDGFAFAWLVGKFHGADQ